MAACADSHLGTATFLSVMTPLQGSAWLSSNWHSRDQCSCACAVATATQTGLAGTAKL